MREKVAVTDVRPPVLTTQPPAMLGDQQPDAVAVREPERSGILVAMPTVPRATKRQMGTSLETAAITQEPPGTEACWQAVEHVCRPIRFARGKANLDDRSRAMLDRLAAAASGCPEVRLSIAGHTDADGPARRNLALSERRARLVVGYLIRRGIDAARLKAVGYGETRPAAPNDTLENRAKNRRIEVEVTHALAAARQGAGNGLPDR
jgi:outer membrane protein OmpA-like peptidoglycan-associated protein